MTQNDEWHPFLGADQHAKLNSVLCVVTAGVPHPYYTPWKTPSNLCQLTSHTPSETPLFWVHPVRLALVLRLTDLKRSDFKHAVNRHRSYIYDQWQGWHTFFGLVWQLGRWIGQTSLTDNVGLQSVMLAEWNDTMVAVNQGVLEAAYPSEYNYKTITNERRNQAFPMKSCACASRSMATVCKCTTCIHLHRIPYPNVWMFPFTQSQHVASPFLARHLVWQLGRWIGQTSLTDNVGLQSVMLAEWNDTMVAVNQGVLEAAYPSEYNYKTITNERRNQTVPMKSCACASRSRATVCKCTTCIHLRRIPYPNVWMFPFTQSQHVASPFLARHLVWQLGIWIGQTSLTDNVGLQSVMLAEWNDTMVAVNQGVLEAAYPSEYNYKTITNERRNQTVPMKSCACASRSMATVCKCTTCIHLRRIPYPNVWMFPFTQSQHVASPFLARHLVWQLGRWIGQTSLTDNVGLQSVMLAEWNDTMVAPKPRCLGSSLSFRVQRISVQCVLSIGTI